MSLRTLAILLLPLALSAADFTWNATDSTTWTDNANWLPDTAYPGSDGNATTDSAIFSGATANSTVRLANADATIGNITFDATAQSYELQINNGAVLKISENGITNNSALVQNITLGSESSSGILIFSGNASADATGSGNINISIDGGSILQFHENASAGNATFHNNSSYAYGGITFGRANTENSTTNTTVTYGDTASAGNATFYNTENATIFFYSETTAADSTIHNNGTLTFDDDSTAGNATIITGFTSTTDENGNTTATAAGSVSFSGNASAANANLTFLSSGTADILPSLQFSENSTAANATITAADTSISFTGNASAANATISLSGPNGTLSFGEYSTGTASTNITLSDSAQLSVATYDGNLTLEKITVANGTASLNLGGSTAQTLTLATDDDLDFTHLAIGESAGKGSLHKAGNGTLTLNATNITGSLIVDGGDLVLLRNTTLSTATLEINNNATLDYNYSYTDEGGNVIAGTHDDIILGGLAGNGTLAINSATDISTGHNNQNTIFTGNITGDGNLSKYGNGTWTLNGTTSTYTGNTHIHTGTLLLDNAQLTGNITIGNIIYIDKETGNITAPDDANATLDYDNSTAAVLSVAPGRSVAGNIHINEYSVLNLGNYDNSTLTHGQLTADNLTLDDNSTIYFGASKNTTNSTLSYSQLHVNDTLTLTENASIVIALDVNSDVFETGTDKLTDIITYNTLNNATLIDGQIIETTLHNTLAFIANITSDGHITFEAYQKDFIDFALTKNQKVVAGALDRVLRPDDGSPGSYNTPLVIMLNNYVAGDKLPKAFDQISPASLGEMANLAFDLSRYDTRIVERRIANWRSDLGESSKVQSMSETIFSVITPTGEVDAPASALFTNTPPDATGITPVHPAPIDSLPWAVYATGIVGGGKADPDSNATGYKYTQGGAGIGIERAFHGRYIFGLQAGYNKSSIRHRNDDEGRIDNEGWRGLVYAGWNGKKGSYLQAHARFTQSDYDTKREVISPSVLAYLPSGYTYQAKGSTDARSHAAMIGGGHDWKFGDLKEWKTGPIARLAYEKLKIDAFTEEGSLAPLSIDRQTPHSLRTQLGWHVSWEAVDLIDNSVWVLDLRLAWEHEYKDTTPFISASFADPTYAAAGTMRVRTHRLPGDTVTAGMGVQWRYNRRFRVDFIFDVEVSAKEANYTSSLGASFRW